MTKCLVIGANGFIGSHLVDRLVSDGHEVTAFDRFTSPPVRYHASTVRQFVGDFMSKSDLAEAVAGQNHVFHFLSTTSPVTADNDPELDLRTNLAQTVSLLESSVKAGIDRFYFASTGGAIYGSQSRSQHSETDATLPVSPYAIGKLTIENYLRYFRAKHDLQSVALRISNPYGTRQHPTKKQGFIPIALRQVATGNPVLRFGNGSMIRDYVYVNDLVAMIAPMTRAVIHHDVYNLGSGQGYSVSQILETLRSVTGVDFGVQEVAVPPTFVDRVVLNTDRYAAEFGEVPLTALVDGVRWTFEEIQTQQLSNSLT